MSIVTFSFISGQLLIRHRPSPLMSDSFWQIPLLSCCCHLVPVRSVRRFVNLMWAAIPKPPEFGFRRIPQILIHHLNRHLLCYSSSWRKCISSSIRLFNILRNIFSMSWKQHSLCYAGYPVVYMHSQSFGVRRFPEKNCLHKHSGINYTSRLKSVEALLWFEEVRTLKNRLSCDCPHAVLIINAVDLTAICLLPNEIAKTLSFAWI